MGQESTVRLDAYPDLFFEGNVSKVLPMANPSEDAPNVQVFEVIVDLKEESSILRPGMSAATEIIVESLTEVVAVPKSAVFSSGDSPVVYLLEESGFTARSVALGLQNTESVVVESGLAPGEKIALVDPTRVRGNP